MGDPLTDAELAAMRARAEAAMPGPWTAEPSCVGPKWGWDVPELEEADYRDSRFGREADAVFIAHARADIPRLLADLDRLRADNAALRRQLAGPAGRRTPVVSDPDHAPEP